MSKPATDPVKTLAPHLRCVLADNASPMTQNGTNTYLLGHSEVTLIDPGPNSDAHLQAILGALGPNQRIVRILVTHAHRDHSALCPRLSEATGAPVLAYGAATTGRSPRLQALADAGLTGGGEGIDTAFEPDQILQDNATVQTEVGEVRALWTPGHMANHLCFQWRDAVFCGDIVMGWASSLVSPPDGDLTAFLNSCDRLAALNARVFYSGHGDPILTPSARCRELIAHRQMRTKQILQTLTNAPQSIPTLVQAIYADLPATMAPAAARNVLAHLIPLCDNGQAQAHPEIGHNASFSSTQNTDNSD